MTIEEAAGQLDDWRRNNQRRDLLVRAAKDAGMAIAQISVHSGLTRQTVYNILALPGE
jgi:lambda repressor-like predicted transcriptional regulator